MHLVVLLVFLIYIHTFTFSIHTHTHTHTHTNSHQQTHILLFKHKCCHCYNSCDKEFFCSCCCCTSHNTEYQALYNDTHSNNSCCLRTMHDKFWFSAHLINSNHLIHFSYFIHSLRSACFHPTNQANSQATSHRAIQPSLVSTVCCSGRHTYTHTHPLLMLSNVTNFMLASARTFIQHWSV